MFNVKAALCAVLAISICVLFPSKNDILLLYRATQCTSMHIEICFYHMSLYLRYKL